MLITSPKKFAALFNEKYVGANRRVTVEDVICMTSCKLIGRHDYYLRDDLEIVRGVLEYEQLRERQPAQEYSEDKSGSRKCKICGQTLLYEPESKAGRPKEYCSECQTVRSKERKKKSRRRNKGLHRPITHN